MQTQRATLFSASLFAAAFALMSGGVFQHLAEVKKGRELNEDNAIRARDVEADKVDVERARFLMECVADWGYEPKECERILHGALPTKPEYAEPGC